MMRQTKLILTIISILLAALMLTGCKWGSKDPLKPDYPVPPVDSNAESMGGDETKLESPEGGGAVGLIYTTTAELSLSSGSISMLFGNPKRSNQNMTVAISVQDIIIAESGLLEPGNRISTLSLNRAGAESMVAEGVYNAKFVVEFYDALSGEKAMVNTEIPIKLTAK